MINKTFMNIHLNTYEYLLCEILTPLILPVPSVSSPHPGFLFILISLLYPYILTIALTPVSLEILDSLESTFQATSLGTLFRHYFNPFSSAWEKTSAPIGAMKVLLPFYEIMKDRTSTKPTIDRP